MRRLLNTLYITTHGAYIAKEGQTIVVSVDKEVKIKIPVLSLNGIVCIGGVGCSPYAMELCAENNVALSFLSESGHFKARVVGEVNGNILVRRAQYRLADKDNESLDIAKMFILAKIVNGRNVLLRAARETDNNDAMLLLKSSALRLKQTIKHIRTTANSDELLGREGEAARSYFDVFNELIGVRKDLFVFKGRSRRPPLDRVNALLSFVYTLLVHDATAALEASGLDPCCGFFHKDRPGRPGLALDLMEEFRGCIADRLVVSMINLQQVKPEQFTITETGGVLMDDVARKTVIAAYQKRKQEEIFHPFIKESVPVGLLVYIQAMLLARFLRNDIDKYPPFFWK